MRQRLGVTIASSLEFFQRCKEAAGKANRMLGFIKRNISFEKQRRNPTLVYQLSQATSGIRRAVLVASLCKRYSKTRSCPAKGYKDDYILA